MSRYVITVDVDPETGELVLPFSDEMLAEIGWVVGDTLSWEIQDDGSWTLRKKDGNEPV
jgi:hypothetical protein